MKQQLYQQKSTPENPSKGKISIVTCCIDDWGGCEELWARSLPFLQSEGYTISVYKTGINPQHPEYVKLIKTGVNLISLTPPVVKESISFRVWRKLWRKVQPEAFKPAPQSPEEMFAALISTEKPGLVVVAQGINFDGVHFGRICSDLNINYVMVSQKAVDFFWPQHQDRAMISRVFKEAGKNIFVSRHNLKLTEEQLGMKIANSEVVFNPVKLSRKIISYPEVAKGYKLACVGRYFILDKGQDILIKILAREEWKNRPLTVTFIGSGADKEALMELATFLNVSNVEFRDYARDISEVWAEHHGLILPSRSEGMPLVIMEAMSAGRMVIVSDAGGNAEIVKEDINGFIGAPFESSFAAAMEKAWQNRNKWKAMGENASEYIKKHVPEVPEFVFATHLKQTIHGE